MLTSCDMDVKVPGALEQGDAIQNIEGLRSFRNQAYNILRSTTTVRSRAPTWPLLQRPAENISRLTAI